VKALPHNIFVNHQICLSCQRLSPVTAIPAVPTAAAATIAAATGIPVCIIPFGGIQKRNRLLALLKVKTAVAAKTDAAFPLRFDGWFY